MAQKGLVLMTWGQDQVDYSIKNYNWTNFEQKSCCEHLYSNPYIDSVVFIFLMNYTLNIRVNFWSKSAKIKMDFSLN